MDVPQLMLAEAAARRVGDHRTAEQMRECIVTAQFHAQLDDLRTRWGVEAALNTAPLRFSDVAPPLTVETLLNARDAVLRAPYMGARGE